MKIILSSLIALLIVSCSSGSSGHNTNGGIGDTLAASKTFQGLALDSPKVMDGLVKED